MVWHYFSSGPNTKQLICFFVIRRQSTTRLKDALHEDECPDQLALTEATHALLRVLWSRRWRSISPRYFVNAVWKHSTLFAARKQQDANEFLNFYIGRVDDELKPRGTKTSVMVGILRLIYLPISVALSPPHLSQILIFRWIYLGSTNT